MVCTVLDPPPMEKNINPDPPFEVPVYQCFYPAVPRIKVLNIILPRPKNIDGASQSFSLRCFLPLGHVLLYPRGLLSQHCAHCNLFSTMQKLKGHRPVLQTIGGRATLIGRHQPLKEGDLAPPRHFWKRSEPVL